MNTIIEDPEVTLPEVNQIPDPIEPEDGIPSESALIIEELTNNGFILVQWIGATGHMRLAPSPNGAIRKFGAENYGLVRPGAYMMIHKDDYQSRFYRRPTPQEKPPKDKVRVTVDGKFGQIIRVTW